jgi:hypothetical protein
MHKSTKLIVALGAAGVVAAAGSAFTATSTIDDPAVNVGSVAQTVSGATITNVVHTYTAATDTTTIITAKAEQLLSTTAGVVKVGINGLALQNCTVAVTDVDEDGVDDDATDFSDITCDITDTANVTSVRFVVNG